MPASLTLYRVFIASPSGLVAHRRKFFELIGRYNRDHGLPSGVYLQPVGWEETIAGVGRPQALINADLRKCDFAVFVFRDRYGSPSTVDGRFASGVEEEWKLASEMFRTGRMKGISLAFLPVAESQLRDPGDQLQRVLAFRTQVAQEKEHLFKQLQRDTEFSEFITTVLANWGRMHFAAHPEDDIDPMLEQTIDPDLLQVGKLPSTVTLTDATNRTAPWEKLLRRALSAAENRQWEAAQALIEAAAEMCAGKAHEAALLRGRARILLLQGQVEEALRLLSEVASRFRQDAEDSIRLEVARARLSIAITLGRVRRHDEAIASFDELIQDLADSQEPQLREQLSQAMYSKAVRLALNREYEKAIIAYDEVIRTFKDFSFGQCRVSVARSVLNKAMAHGECGRTLVELQGYDGVVRLYGRAKDSQLQDCVALALLNKAAALGDMEEFEEQFGVFDDLMERLAGALAPPLVYRRAQALLQKAIWLGELGRSMAAIRLYGEIIEQFQESTDQTLAEFAVVAHLNRAVRFGLAGRPDEAIAAYDEFIARYAEVAGDRTQWRVARALRYKGQQLQKTGHVRDAIRAWEPLTRRYLNVANPKVRSLSARSFLDRAAAYESVRDFAEAQKEIESCIRLFESDNDVKIQALVEIARGRLVQVKTVATLEQ